VGAAFGILARRALRRWWRKPASISGYSSSGSGVVDAMLALAEVGPDDVVYDLGCGDGRIVIEAARRCGARGVGLDLDPERIRESKENARRAAVEHRVMFEQRDAMTADLAAATVVTMYLPPRASLELAARLMRELQPGSRIVSHNTDLNGWDRVQVCDGEGFPSLHYLRRVPRRQGDSADARGISHSTPEQKGTDGQTA
jgi:SAM-dependent methyltransferase